jgi:hypothetical protein
MQVLGEDQGHLVRGFGSLSQSGGGQDADGFRGAAWSAGPDAMLGALELVVAHVVLDRCGCQGCRPQPPLGQQPGEQLLDRAAGAGGDLVGGNGRVGDRLAAAGLRRPMTMTTVGTSNLLPTWHF